MIVRQSIIFLSVVVLFTFSSLAVATNQGSEEKNQTTLIINSAQQTPQHPQHQIPKDKKIEQLESSKPIKSNMADYCRKHTC